MLTWTIRSSDFKGFNLDQFKDGIKNYQMTLQNPETGFFHLPNNTHLIKEAVRVYNKFKHKKYFVHIGIGGSALGPEMLLKSLRKNNDTKFIFLNNIDPEEMHSELAKVNLKEALIYVVSKSGTTAETVAAMSIVCNQLNKLCISEESYRDYFVFCTDPQKGDLRKLTDIWKIEGLEIPSNIGGRFSVLTPVGFLPALFAGIDAQKLLTGAAKAQTYLNDIQTSKSFYELGLWLKDLHDHGVNETVIMPYSSKLKEFSSWYVQLWAESLGKLGKGLTPIPGYGATDQHSQMQLFMEGPNNKVLFLIEIEEFNQDFSLKNNVPVESFKHLSEFKLSELMKAEFEGTLKALEENKRSVVHIKLKQLTEEYLGELILFSECLTALVGRLILVDPFNQPGVEAGKKYANNWLKSTHKLR